MVQQKETYDADVIVVGGGLAGLTAAREVTRRGLTALVVEARDRVGGRAWLKRDALAGHALEMGGAWFDPSETFAWAEIQRYRLPVTRGVVADWPNAWLKDGTLHRSSLPVDWRELASLERLAFEMNLAARRIDLARPLAEQSLEDLDIPLDAFLARQPMQPETRAIAEVFLRAYGSGPAPLISTLHLLRRAAAAGGMVGFVTSGSGYRLQGGTAALVDALAADCGAPLRLSQPVRSIRQDAGGVTLATADGRLRARAAVIAVPMNALKRIAFDPPLSREKLALSTEELGCIGFKVWMLVRDAPTDLFACGAGSGIDWLSSEGGGTKEGALMVGYGCDADALDVSDRRAVERAVRSFLTEAEVIDHVAHDWRHDPYAGETWAVFRPGQVIRAERALRQAEGRLHFAGSHSATRWVGFMDGAIESGIRAGAETVAALREAQSAVGSR
ncbi:MAG TPA: NAD(P)/FAD-dependent oxidoreductase [Kiloniellales bacterium]|nr:NAD(P)/FAD-dependent oxidoreductase [Kiloniellales bacterium]